MEIVNLPSRWHSENTARQAARSGLYRPASQAPLTLVSSRRHPAYCASCAAHIEFGTVWRGEQAFCSVECSLGGDRPA